MTLPQLMFKIWDGDDNERFTFRDMNRLTFNANQIAAEAGVTTVEFVEADRSQQFRYDEVQKLENLTDSIAMTLGLSIIIEGNWRPMRSITFRDFERIESNLYACYQALGGVGDRIPDNKRLITVSAVLFPDAWSGSPAHIDLTVPFVHTNREVMVFVPYYADEEQRMAEYKARMSASIYADRTLRITANGSTPRVAIPIKITLGGLETIKDDITLSKDSWTGDGPWIQTFSLPEAPENVIIGLPSGVSADAAKAYAEAVIHASAVSGSTVTVRALYSKPTENIPIAVLYSTTEVA